MKYFSVEELTRTSTGLDNTPNEQEKQNIVKLIESILDPAREEFGAPIIVTSGFRSEAVNNKVGGVKTSQHRKGQAADIDTDDNKRLYDILKEQGNYDQLIWEKGNDEAPAWIHVSFSENPRKQAFRIK